MGFIFGFQLGIIVGGLLMNHYHKGGFERVSPPGRHRRPTPAEPTPAEPASEEPAPAEPAPAQASAQQ